MPRFHGREAGAIGEAVNQLVVALQENIESRQRVLEAERRLVDSRGLARLVEERIGAQRRKIARALRDELGQSVTAIRSLAQSIALRSQALPEIDRAASLIGDEAGRLYDQMHGMIPRLAPVTLDSLELDEALEELVQRVRAAHPDVRITMRCSLGPQAQAGAGAQVAYPIVQEAVTYANRHRQAREIHVMIDCTPALMELSVVDNGLGLAPNWQQREHFGLRWLTDRAQALGGNLELRASSRGGTELLATLPLPA